MFKAVGEPKTELIRFRLSQSDRNAIEASAKAVGLTMSAYILFKLGLNAGEALGDAILKSKDGKE